MSSAGAPARAGGGTPSPAPSASPSGTPVVQVPLPVLRACARRIGRGLAVRPDSAFETQLMGVCAYEPGDELERCTNSYLRKVSAFLSNAGHAYALCEDASGEKRRCFDDLTRRDLLSGASDRFAVCDRAEGDQRQCMIDVLGRRPDVYFNDLLQACELPAGSGRQCVIDRMVDSRRASIEDARDSCKFYDVETRACVEDYQRRRGLFAWPLPAVGAKLPEHPGPVASPAPGQRLLADVVSSGLAEEICRISHIEDRECVVTTFLNRFFPETAPEERPNSLRNRNIKLCITASHERDGCLRILRDYSIGANEQDSYAICNIPNFETRACVISKYIHRDANPSLLDLLSGPATPLSYLNTCTAEAAAALTGHALDAEIARLSCQFKR